MGICFGDKKNDERRRGRNRENENDKSLNIDSKNSLSIKEDYIDNTIISNSQISNHDKPSINIGVKNQKLKDFLNAMIYQNSQDDSDDTSYNELLKIEIEELQKEVDKLSEDLINGINKQFNFKNIKKEVINSIVQNEITNSMIKRKISSMIKEYENDINKHSIPYLKIILVGRKKIGKTDLVNYMLELEPNENENKNKKLDLQEYVSEKVPFLKLVEFKGIGFDSDSNTEIIGTNIFNYINNLQKSENKDYIHCIWYCMTETKFEKPEIAVLRKLKNSYKNDNVLPVIAVYTKTESHEIANQMEEHIKSQGIDTIFIKTLAKSFTMQNGTVKNTFGKEELLKATLEKCTSSLQSELINLMIKKVSDEIKSDILDKYTKLLQKIQENIISKFVSEFNQVLNDGELIDYIINFIIENIKEFNEGKILNKSFNLLNESDFIKEVKTKVTVYKNKVKKLIEPVVEQKSKKFLDSQAKIEIEKGNMKIKNKKSLKEFNRAIEIFLKKNLYYISQRIMISYIIEKIYSSFFNELNAQLKSKIENILNINNNPDIKLLLEHIFLRKLKDFGDKWGINIKEKNFKIDVFDFPDKAEIEKDENKQNNNNLITNSFVFINDDKKFEDNQLKDIPLENNWFPYNARKNWKYIKEKKEILENYLDNVEIQDSFFNIKTTDKIFASFKEYMKKDLTMFLHNNKSKFIKSIDNSYQNKKISFDNKIIPKILDKENISNIYDKLTEDEIIALNNDLSSTTIDYMTILVVGRSGIGKSKLISKMTNLNAKTGVGFRVTLENEFYKGKIKLSFLQMIDTRGIEQDTRVGLSKIIDNTLGVIESQKLKAKNNYNENIQCIYYCVKGSALEDSEIEAIKKIKNNKEKIPVIVVFTMGVNQNDIDSMENQIKSRLNLPFINVLAEKIDEQESYGLDDLLKLTLEECQNAIKGNVFEAIKKKLSENVISKLKEINQKIKISINNTMVEKLINFKKVVNNNDLYQMIYEFIEVGFIEYIKIGDNNINELKEESSNEFQQLKILNDYIKDYIQFYQNTSKTIIQPALKTRSLELLDQQVILEKTRYQSIETTNKKTRDSLKEIIQNFLELNFDYISQKYLLYKLLHDLSEPFSEELEKKINEIVEQSLKTNKALELIKNSYDIIFKAFKEKIYKYSKNEKIYEDNENKTKKNNSNYTKNNYNSSKSNTKEDNLECPYPSFKYYKK